MESSSLTTHSSEISLKDFILKIREWMVYLWGKKVVILIVSLIGAGLGLTYALNRKTEYIAELTFVLEDSKSSGLGAYAGIASQFGIDLGGGSNSSGIFSGDNIIEFLKSRLMVEKTLLSPIQINGKQRSLADFYIEINNMNKGWGPPPLKNLQYPPALDRSKFSLQQDSILQVIYSGIIKKNLYVDKPDKKLSFITVKCTTPNELFSKVFSERLVKVATDFYIQTKTQRSKITVDKLQFKADSITALLNRTTYSVAASQDMNLNPARSMANVKTELVTRDKVVLQTMYAEVIKNLELSKMAMAQETPIIQVVDTPILPLKKDKVGKLKGIVIGGFLGFFLIFIWLSVARAYREIMN